jgi:EmrB/QacA subfamily drug resistance transporter
LDGTIVNLALPKIGQGLQASFSDFQWIIDGYLLSLSALILLGGSLGDILGRKKVYQVGVAGFGVSSLLCALAPSATILIFFRVIQGVFGALLVPGALAIINTNFPKELRGKAIGIWTAFGSVATVAGPLLGGLILQYTSWRYIFVINVPLIAACLALSLPNIQESKMDKHRQIDYRGSVLAVLALAGLTYGLIEGPLHHWGLAAWTALVGGALAGVWFIYVERHAKDPIVELDLFASRNFSGSNIMTFAMYGALSGLTFALVLYLQQTLHYSSLEAGFSLLPVSILMFLFSGRVGNLSAQYGPRLFMTVGPITTAVGMLYLYFLKPGQNYVAGILPGALLFGIGLTLTVAPLTTTVMSAVNETSSGIASGINNAVSRAAGLMVIAVLGLLGARQVYHFAMLLCATLAFVAGLVSFVFIENITLKKTTNTKQ